MIKNNRLTAGDADFEKVLQKVSRKGKRTGDFIFLEVFKAKNVMKNSSGINVINILKDCELLYPVSFVVKKEDTVLKNFINIRLMEMRDTKANDSDNLRCNPAYPPPPLDPKISELEYVIKLQALKSGIEEEEFKDIFIQKYDLNKLME